MKDVSDIERVIYKTIKHPSHHTIMYFLTKATENEQILSFR